jgi:hypothetical protein
MVTDDEARHTAWMGGGWVDWDYDNRRPGWTPEDEPTIKLDGDFTAKELLAILHFAPKDLANGDHSDDCCGYTYEQFHRGPNCEFKAWYAKQEKK